MRNNEDSKPFGQSDASRVDFKELEETYISRKGSTLSEYINTSVRVIIGKKGSGKTLYLKGIRDYLTKKIVNTESNYVTEIDNEPPETSLIVKISSWCENNSYDLDETWRKIWKVVILRTCISHILKSQELKKRLSKGEFENLGSYYINLVPKGNAPTSIFNELRSFLASFNSLRDLDIYLNQEIWGAFESELAVLIKKMPPIYLFLDQLDDDFSKAPFYWLKCQFGLFQTIFRFVRNSTYGGRLHIIACLREMVYAYVLNTQHGSKYLSEPKLKVLRWDINKSKHFLQMKIKTLNPNYLLNPHSENSALNYFACKKIFISRDNGFEELIENYILRHTMLLPRDIINIGNVFYSKRTSNMNGNSSKPIKDAVRIVARQIAREQMKIASLFLSTQWIHRGAVEDGSFDAYVDESTIRGIQKNLEDLIQNINKDRFSRDLLNKKLKTKVEFGFNENEKPFEALYSAGLLGYVEIDTEGNKIELFFSESRETDYSLPLNKEEFVFHSSLIDFLKIKPIGKPVYASY